MRSQRRPRWSRPTRTDRVPNPLRSPAQRAQHAAVCCSQLPAAPLSRGTAAWHCQARRSALLLRPQRGQAGRRRRRAALSRSGRPFPPLSLSIIRRCRAFSLPLVGDLLPRMRAMLSAHSFSVDRAGFPPSDMLARRVCSLLVDAHADERSRATGARILSMLSSTARVPNQGSFVLLAGGLPVSCSVLALQAVSPSSAARSVLAPVAC